MQQLARRQEELKQYIQTIDLDLIGADTERCGLKGSPTIVAATEKVGEIGGSCTMHEGHSPEEMVHEIIKNTGVREYLVASK